MRVVLVLLFVGVVGATLPGFSAILTQSALNYATKVGLQILEEKLSTLTIPDVDGDEHSITYEITDIVIHDLKIPEGAVKIDTSIGVVVSVDDISCEITAKWHGRENVWPHPSASGDATIDVSSTDLSAAIKIYDNTADSNRVATKADGVSTHIGHLDLHFSGSGLDWILDLLKDVFGNKIKDSAESAITNAVTKAINDDLNSEIRTLPITVPIGKVAELDFSLTGNPIFHSSYLEIPLKGEFLELGHKTDPPFTPQKLPTAPVTSDMVQTFLGEYVVDTASYAFYKAGKMKYVLDNTMIPPSSPINLNTSSWQDIVPALYKDYPNYLMKAVASASEPPTATFKKTGAGVFGKGLLDVYVVSPKNGSLIPAFVLGMNVSAAGKVIVKDQDITGNLTYIDSGVWVEKSYIGDFNVVPLRSIVKFLTLVVILPYFNYYLQIGIPIPSVDGVDFVDPVIGYGDGYVYVSSDIKYSPPETKE